jgi:hypothetical protein
MEDDDHEVRAEARKAERAGGRSTTAIEEMGGHAGQGGGGSPVPAWAPELPRMEDDGQEAWAETTKMSAVESDAVDKAATDERASKAEDCRGRALGNVQLVVWQHNAQNL